MDVALRLEFCDLASQAVNLKLLRLLFPVAGEGLRRIETDLLDSFAKTIVKNDQSPACLRNHYAMFPNKPSRFDLELPTELTPLHDAPPAS